MLNLLRSPAFTKFGESKDIKKERTRQVLEIHDALYKFSVYRLKQVMNEELREIIKVYAQISKDVAPLCFIRITKNLDLK